MQDVHPAVFLFHLPSEQRIAALDGAARVLCGIPCGQTHLDDKVAHVDGQRHSGTFPQCHPPDIGRQTCHAVDIPDDMDRRNHCPQLTGHRRLQCEQRKRVIADRAARLAHRAQ